MSGGPLVGGIDAGTSRIRAILFEADGTLVAADERPTPVDVLGEGSAEHDMEAIADAALAALDGALARIDDRKRLRSLAVASCGEAGTLVDAAGRPLTRVIAWYDTRTAKDLADFTGHFGFERLQAITGLCPDPTFTLLKLLWLRRNEPAVFARATRWLHVADYLAFTLSGEMATDTSLASRTMAIDLARGCWSREILDAARIPFDLMPRLLPMGTRLGTLRQDVASALGLDPACTIATGGHDHIAGAVAIGGDRAGTLVDSMGTAEALNLSRPSPVGDPEAGRLGYNQGLLHIETKTWYMFSGLPTSGGAIEWFRRGVAGGESHASLIEAASGVPAGSHGVGFFPHLRLGSPPFPDPVARGGFFGLGADIERPVLYRAVLEGVALDTAQILRRMVEFDGGARIDRILAIGGSTRNDLLMRIKAALFGRAIDIAVMPEAVSLGAAILGGLAAGIWGSLAEAQEACRPELRRIEPDEAMLWGDRDTLIDRYAEGYALQRQLHRLRLTT
ncbi:MAG: FGGY family carbohydrate kinase [Geminicoccaceae bacterium]